MDKMMGGESKVVGRGNHQRRELCNCGAIATAVNFWIVPDLAILDPRPYPPPPPFLPFHCKFLERCLRPRFSLIAFFRSSRQRQLTDRRQETCTPAACGARGGRGGSTGREEWRETEVFPRNFWRKSQEGRIVHDEGEEENVKDRGWDRGVGIRKLELEIKVLE